MAGTFAVAAGMAASPPRGPVEPPAPLAPAAPELVADPRTGIVYADLGEVTTTTLAELVAVYEQWVADLARWRRAVEAEIVTRLKREGHRSAVVGDWELSYEPRRRREWDAGQLRHAVQRLVDDGTVAAGELPEGLFREQVGGAAALALLNRLVGDPHELVADCFSWTESRPKLEVVRSVDLADALRDGGR